MFTVCEWKCSSGIIATDKEKSFRQKTVTPPNTLPHVMAGGNLYLDSPDPLGAL
jgi:hypothetical protein